MKIGATNYTINAGGGLESHHKINFIIFHILFSRKKKYVDNIPFYYLKFKMYSLTSKTFGAGRNQHWEVKSPLIPLAAPIIKRFFD